ncbi:MAG TPA: fumarylacetoacetate hydrolase family protein [candidate division Zixibacteria bacterium]|nr:fumarylacetoacetate hydrolase family protein [candidate division Zixibacteria bacterium]MDD4916199.1 fumarylacetoacetate hydrolase family protein [candidate division Zixibacteria bacterium]MDM7972366.1 fumarylacetoacetate hydrolase family protein [candidate division Zixibacteria bacterium]HOZ07457.1 fumarylacetoacetate hydrolase family protein [candidate division Zixibacteria bacterium]HPM37504.1 fumarylacetoacetate hydrolase family protein [candidate division Zixibacteria bacterium]
MRLVSFRTAEHPERLGLVHADRVYDLAAAASALGRPLPSTMAEFLTGGEAAMASARAVHEAVVAGAAEPLPSEGAALLAPVPHPPSCRDGYAFRQHVATARRNRGVPMIPEFDQFPVFYFTNHRSIVGPGDVLVETDHLVGLDFELECAVVIDRPGRNIRAEEADRWIAGYTIMNDFSARTLQMEEMKLNLGPAKGKDFATAIGPWLVTPEELADRRLSTPGGAAYNLRMTARHNGRLVSEGNLRDMTWTFAEIIERASYGVDLFPGDVIGSGTVGTGCYLELNGTWALAAAQRGESFTPVWLRAGDTIELEIERLGVLRNRIVKADRDYSILARKKTSAAAP